MRTGTLVFIIAATIAWAVLLFVSIHAVLTMGLAAVADSFNGGFAHPWLAQFNTDLVIYLLLAAAWMIWRSSSRVVGIVSAILAINLGSLFILPVLILATLRTGNVKTALLGRHSQIN